MAIPQTASGTTRDKQSKVYVDSPSRGPDYSAEEVYVGNLSNQSIPVSDYRGKTKAITSEVIVASGLTLPILSKVVPPEKNIDLLSVNVSGENKADYDLVINLIKVDKVRTYYTYFNEKIQCNDLSLIAGEIMRVDVTNNGTGSASFNATIYYKEYDEP